MLTKLTDSNAKLLTYVHLEIRYGTFPKKKKSDMGEKIKKVIQLERKVLVLGLSGSILGGSPRLIWGLGQQMDNCC